MGNPQRVTSFRNQRVIATLTFFIIAFIATTSVLWFHLENVMGTGWYATFAKAGLMLLPFVGILLTIWELFVDDPTIKRKHPIHPTVRRLINWCFVVSWLVLALEVVHSGGVLKYESSSKEQQAKIELLGKTQAQIAGETTRAAIEASGKQAQEMNARGQTKTARSQIRAGQGVAADANAVAQRNVTEAANSAEAESFLPKWYINGGMYAALPSFAVLILAITMAFARAAASHVDKNDDGKPDSEQPSEELEPEIKEMPTHFDAQDGSHRRNP